MNCYEYIQKMLKENLFAVVYPKDKTAASAEKMVDLIDSAVGIAEFEDEDGKLAFGVLIDKTKEAEHIMKLSSKQEEQNDNNM